MGMIFGKSWQDQETGWPEPKSDPDGQNLTQMVSEADLLENKALLRQAVMAMIEHGIVEYSGPVVFYDEEDRKPPQRKRNG